MDTLIDLNRLRADLDAKRQAFVVSWNTFAGFAGVSPAMFSRLNAGSTITLDTFARLCATCGLDPADYMPPSTRTHGGTCADPSAAYPA